MKSILSTKKLTSEQKKTLLEAGFKVTEHDFIQIEPLEFTIPEKMEAVIFTSKNAVEMVSSFRFQVSGSFCVGEKTKKLLEENGMNVVASADYGKELAEIIVENFPNEHFTFFCGNRRRDELPSILKKNKISFEEIEVYKTILKPKHFEQTFDGVLFFSPSGVESFCSENELKNSTAFCIGTTTAAEAKKHTDKVVVAEKPTVESVIDPTCKILKTL